MKQTLNNRIDYANRRRIGKFNITKRVIWKSKSRYIA